MQRYRNRVSWTRLSFAAPLCALAFVAVFMIAGGAHADAVGYQCQLADGQLPPGLTISGCATSPPAPRGLTATAPQGRQRIVPSQLRVIVNGAPVRPRLRTRHTR